MSVFRSAIKRLFGARRPSKIAGLVVAVVVYSVNAEPAWGWSNIFENPIPECWIIIDPAGVHCDSAAGVARIGFVIRIKAAPFDACPKFVQPRAICSSFSVGRRVSTAIRPVGFKTKATTTFSITISKEVCPDGGTAPTLATTNAVRTAVARGTRSFSRKTNYGEATKFFTGKVQDPHVYYYNTCDTYHADVKLKGLS